MWHLALLCTYHELGLNSWALVKLLWISCWTMITLNELMAICCLSILLFIEEILPPLSQDSRSCDLNKLMNYLLQSWCVPALCCVSGGCFLFSLLDVIFPLMVGGTLLGKDYTSALFPVQASGVWRGLFCPTLEQKREHSCVSAAVFIPALQSLSRGWCGVLSPFLFTFIIWNLENWAMSTASLMHKNTGDDLRTPWSLSAMDLELFVNFGRAKP